MRSEFEANEALARYVEQDCTIEHNGRTFTSGGAVVSEQFARGYLKLPSEALFAVGTVTDWHGAYLGSARIVAKWRTPRSFVSSHMMQVECVIDSAKYTGRSAGNGMVWSGKPCAR